MSESETIELEERIIDYLKSQGWNVERDGPDLSCSRTLKNGAPYTFIWTRFLDMCDKETPVERLHVMIDESLQFIGFGIEHRERRAASE